MWIISTLFQFKELMEQVRHDWNSLKEEEELKIIHKRCNIGRSSTIIILSEFTEFKLRNTLNCSAKPRKLKLKIGIRISDCCSMAVLDAQCLYINVIFAKYS